jgi:hypothetical protein
LDELAEPVARLALVTGRLLDDAKADGERAYALGRLASVHLAVLTELHRQVGWLGHVDPVEQLLAQLGGPAAGGFETTYRGGDGLG